MYFVNIFEETRVFLFFFKFCDVKFSAQLVNSLSFFVVKRPAEFINQWLYFLLRFLKSSTLIFLFKNFEKLSILKLWNLFNKIINKAALLGILICNYFVVALLWTMVIFTTSITAFVIPKTVFKYVNNWLKFFWYC